MRIAPTLLTACLLAATLAPVQPAAAQTRAHPPRAAAKAGPKAIGRWEDWQAATHTEAGATVCYAFTRATSSAPTLPGRGDVVLTVTQRPGGRDSVALSAGFAYAPTTEVSVQVDQAALSFYTAKRSAFARDGRAAVAAFLHGRQAVARSPGPRGAAVVDSFGLRGFAAAYAAINKACPGK